ncbi:alpha/beta fold hydrolase [Streptomyces sp. NPDC050803]|uniref:thioesterase II family protein n=1 Tax=Streptomyces sp. NPDC050803 TaxID=3154635 RepID=UPI0034199A6B
MKVLPSDITFRELLDRGAQPIPVQEAEVACFLIHHSGGSAASFYPLIGHLPENWRSLAVELPGRGASMGRGHCHSTAEVVERLIPAVLAQGAERIAVFGHSLGALVAYELVRELERRGVAPVWLGVSGSPAPQLVAGRRLGRRDLWSRERLVAFLRDLGGTPEEMLAVPDVVDYMVSVLRGDLRVVDTYEHVDGPPLATPISVYSGDADPMAGTAQLAGWRERGRGAVDIRTWPGGHFYLFDHVESFTESLVADVRSAVRQAAGAAPEKKGAEL